MSQIFNIGLSFIFMTVNVNNSDKSFSKSSA